MSTSVTLNSHKPLINSHKPLSSRRPRFAPGIMNILRAWRVRSRNRRALREEFDRASPKWLAHIEQDIGLEPGSLQREMSKPFWAE